jgi:hypothetical protein
MNLTTGGFLRNETEAYVAAFRFHRFKPLGSSRDLLKQ